MHADPAGTASAAAVAVVAAAAVVVAAAVVAAAAAVVVAAAAFAAVPAVQAAVDGPASASLAAASAVASAAAAGGQHFLVQVRTTIQPSSLGTPRFSLAIGTLGKLPKRGVAVSGLRAPHTIQQSLSKLDLGLIH